MTSFPRPSAPDVVVALNYSAGLNYSDDTIDYDTIDHFIRGFDDDDPYCGEKSDAYLLGEKFRELYP